MGKGEDDRVIERGPRGRCMIKDLLAVVVGSGQGDKIMSPFRSFTLVSTSNGAIITF